MRFLHYQVALNNLLRDKIDPLSILGDFRFQMLSCNKFIIKDLNIHHL